MLYIYKGINIHLSLCLLPCIHPKIVHLFCQYLLTKMLFQTQMIVCP